MARQFKKTHLSVLISTFVLVACGGGSGTAPVDGSPEGNLDNDNNVAEDCIEEDVLVKRTSSRTSLKSIQETIYLRGTFNDWQTTNLVYNSDADAYEATVTIDDNSYRDGTVQFKVADDVWGSYNCGAPFIGDAAFIGQPFTVSCLNAEDIVLAIENGDYKFSYSIQDDGTTVTVTEVSDNTGGNDQDQDEDRNDDDQNQDQDEDRNDDDQNQDQDEDRNDDDQNQDQDEDRNDDDFDFGDETDEDDGFVDPGEETDTEEPTAGTCNAPADSNDEEEDTTRPADDNDGDFDDTPSNGDDEFEDPADDENNGNDMDIPVDNGDDSEEDKGSDSDNGNGDATEEDEGVDLVAVGEELFSDTLAGLPYTCFGCHTSKGELKDLPASSYTADDLYTAFDNVGLMNGYAALEQDQVEALAAYINSRK